MADPRLRELAANPQFIPDIYNYCDRWCERCPMTARCLLYARDHMDDPVDRTSPDPNKQGVGQCIREATEEVILMVKEFFESRGIDLDAIGTEAVKRQLEKRRRRARPHPLSRRALGYAKAVDEWFAKHRKLLKKKKDRDFVRAVKSQVPADASPTRAAQILDAVDVIWWYQQQIHVLLTGALASRQGEESVRGQTEEYPENPDGWAKVALIDIANSVTAWSRLRQFFPDDHDSILDVLVRLERLRRMTLEEFPGAPAFQRPGFDYIPETTAPEE